MKADVATMALLGGLCLGGWAMHQAWGYGDPDLEALTQNVYCEAGNQSWEGMLAVAFVTMQRLHDRRWPDTVHRVVYQPGQFSWTAQGCRPVRGAEARRTWRDARHAAQIALAGDQDANPAPGACFFARNEVQADWMRDREIIAVIGEHTFYGC